MTSSETRLHRAQRFCELLIILVLTYFPKLLDLFCIQMADLLGEKKKTNFFSYK